jgi:O-succinylbenzoic acid--CoA ligase
LDTAKGPWVISLVPTQLQRLLLSASATEWLRGFRLIFIGGGPSSPELTDEAVGLGLPLALTYGMTETGAMVAGVRPRDYRRGERAGADALPHARMSLTAESTICIEGPSVFRGYFPEWRDTRRFETDDLGRIDDDGRLHVLGRKDAVIITGGKKVHPLEVETTLRATRQFPDVAVIGVPDVEWGETVVACFPQSETAGPDLEVVERELANNLASYKRPKRYVAITPWPRNAQGKLNRSELLRRVVGAD